MVMQSKAKVRRFTARSTAGSLSVLLPAFIVLALVGIAAFGMDISHNVTVRTELQGATDAGALAGAQSLIDPKTERDAYNDATTVTGNNTADGKGVSNSNNRFTVIPQQDSWDSSDNSCKFTVSATKQIDNIFARLFKHNTDTVQASSTAQAWRSITAVQRDILFPLAVSLDTTNGHTKPLWKHNVGETITFDINSQQYKNAAFTSFDIKNPNANLITKIVDQLLGYEPFDGTIPAMKISDDLNLINGVAEQKQLAKGDYLTKLTDGRELIIPVMTGDPPYNQKRQLVGFITVKIKNIQLNQSGGQVEKFTVELVKGLTKGAGGIPTGSGNGGMDNGLKDLSPGTCKLVS